MADSENQQTISQTDTTQQVTSQKPATKQKNPNRVAAGKATAAKTKIAREAKNVLTTTQWLSVISIVVSLAGIYYKREEIKGLLTKKSPPITPPPVPPVLPRRSIQPMD